MIVARPGKPKIVVLGFHPVLTGMRYELATPLLFANLLRWVSPEIFRRWEISGGSVGTVKLVMDQDTAAAGREGHGGGWVGGAVHAARSHAEFLFGHTGRCDVVAGDREYLYSLTLPQLWEAKWTPPADAQNGIPRFTQVLESSSDLWPWLALAGGLGLLVEWLMFGRFRRGMMRRAKTVAIRAETRGGAGMIHANEQAVVRGGAGFSLSIRASART